MPEDKKQNHTTQVTIAMIGAIAVIISALIEILPKLLSTDIKTVETPEVSNQEEETKEEIDLEKLENWYIWGKDSYRVTIDGKIYHSSPRSFLIESLDKKKLEHGGLSLQLKPYKEYIGKKIFIKGYIKSENVTNAFLWFKSIDKDNAVTAEKTISIREKSDWYPFELTLKIPSNSKTIYLVISMAGGHGKVWVDDISFGEI